MMIGWNIFHWVATAVFVFAGVGAVWALRSREYSKGALSSATIAVAILGGFILLLGITLDRPPMRTMGETRLWYSFFMLVAGIITYARWHYRWILSFSTVMATVFMIINIVRPEIHDKTLMPALQSVWFIPHVAVYMFSYALLGCATLVALYWLFVREDLSHAIRQLVYGGITFFTIGMFTGALWAKEAWGEYWSWDAKESWAAVTWMLYMLYIHTADACRHSKKWSILILLLAFIALQMCWYGVNYLPTATESVHIYNR